MKLSAIKLNPNNPRLIKDDRFKKLCKSITEFPKMMELRPIIVDDAGIILGGNMRFRALQELKYKDIPDNWVKKASELTEDEKKRFIIADNVGFGDWDMDDLANNWEAQDLQDWGLEIPSFEAETESGTETENPYTQKVEAPVYEITGKKPELKDLYNLEKHNELVKQINESKIPEAEKEFLKLCATRHIVFSYQDIAEYYAHSSKEMQELMENSALVIIDFNKAIELGYVKISEEVEKQYRQEYEDDE